MSEKKLHKSSKEKKLWGVCGGLAEYFDLDPALVRIAYAALTIFSAGFPGVLLYIVMAFAIPRRNNYIDNH